MSNNSTSTGLSLGTVLAVILSWTANHSVIWCIIHAICGWFYVFWILFK